MMKFGNKSGFSLIEMVIAMGLATGLLVFYMKMQGEQAKKAYTAKVNTEVETFFSDFKGTIARNGFCSKSFESKILSDNSETKIDSIKNPKGDIRYKVGELYGTKTMKLTGITLKNFKADDKAGFDGIATIQIDLEKNGNIYGSKIINKTMEVSVTRDEGKKILHCGSLGSGGAMNIIIGAPAAAAPGTNASPGAQGTDPASVNTGTQSQTSTQSTQSSSPSSSSSNSNSGTGSSQGSGSVLPPSAQSDSETQKAIQAEMEKNPELKKLQDNLKKMQEQHQDIDNLED